jgi:hypothetical protein
LEAEDRVWIKSEEIVTLKRNGAGSRVRRENELRREKHKKIIDFSGTKISC